MCVWPRYPGWRRVLVEFGMSASEVQYAWKNAALLGTQAHQHCEDCTDRKKEGAGLEESGLYDARDDGHVESGAHDMACVPQRKHVSIRMADSKRHIQNNFLRGVATRPPLGLGRVLAQTKTLDGLTAFRTEWTIFDKRSRAECHRKHACRRMRCGAMLMFGTVHPPNM
eukprot:4264310-Amphidinium_carterae.1